MHTWCIHFLKKTKHIDIQLDKAKRAAQIQEAEDLEYNRQIILILLDIAKTLVGKLFPSEVTTTIEHCNFYQVVLLLSRHVPNLKRWLSDKSLKPYHVTYLSPQSQNQFITLLEKEQRGKVIEVKRAAMFSVMADTTREEEHTDRLSVVLRYVNATGKSTERLLDLSAKTEDKTSKRYPFNDNAVWFEY